MTNMYIDESGSIHPTSQNLNRYFIIGIIIPNNPLKLKRVYKNFIRSNYKNLKKLDTDGKMFNSDGKFLELKGSSMDKPMKIKFLNYFCRNNLFKISYIILDNNKIEERFIRNKARTFNYLLKLFLINSIEEELKKLEEEKYIFPHFIFP